MLNARAGRSKVCDSSRWVFAAAVIVALAPAVAAQAEPAEQPRFSYQRGTATVTPPRWIDPSAAPQIGASTADHRGAAARPKDGLSDAAYRALKAQAAGRAVPTLPTEPPAPPSRAAGSSAGSATPLAVTNFDGAVEVSCGNLAPADTALAVGDNTPAYPVLQLANDCVYLFTKAGALAPGYPKSIIAFFGGSGLTFRHSRALYDWVNHRYAIAAIQINSPNPNSLAVMVSEGDDPGGLWCGFSAFGASDFDFPRLGQDTQAIYVALNAFDHSTGAFQGEIWEIVGKKGIYACNLSQLAAIFGPTVNGVLVDSTQPANVWNPADNPRAGFFVGSQNINFGGGHCQTSCDSLYVWAVSNPFGSGGPELSMVSVKPASTYSLPPSAQQPNSASLIDTGDTRISGQVSYAAGSLFASLTTNGGFARAGAVLYQIEPALNDGNPNCGGGANLCAQITGARISNEVALLPFLGVSTYYATQQPDAERNVTTVFNTSGVGTFTAAYPGVAYTSRRVTQTPNTYHDSGIALQAGRAAYSQFNWGSYTAVAPAGLGSGGPTVAWFSGMYTGNAGNWRTAIGKTGYTAISQP